MNTRFNINRKTLLRSLIFFVAVAVISIMFPKHTSTKYNYSVWRIWDNDPVITAIDFPVYKSADIQKHIEDSIKSNFKPIYYRDNDISKKAITEYLTELSATYEPGLTFSIHSMLNNTLKNIYDVGVLDTIIEAAADTIRLLPSVQDSVGSPIPASRFATLSSAPDSLYKAIQDNPTLISAVDNVFPDFTPNIIYDSIQTESELLALYEKYARTPAIVSAGTKIVDRGDLVTPYTYNVLKAYEVEKAKHSEDNSLMRIISNACGFVLIFIMIGILFAYLKMIRPQYYENIRIILLLSLIVTAFVIISGFLFKTFNNGIYIVPFTMIPILLVVFLDSRSAFFTYTLTILLCGALSFSGEEFFIIQFAAGFVALVSIRELSQRSQLLRAATMVFITYSVVYTAIVLMQSGSIRNIEPTMFVNFFFNSLLISFAYILIFLIEKSFGFISRVTLVELSDINHPLLRELSQKCPGTFQHSMAVSNLAAAATSALGGNVQLVRAGALYHDIGKISNPAFFTENQHGINPHDSLSPEQSARIVIGHVTDGVRRAEKAKLPSQMRDFILQHHGRGVAKYFYTTYCNQHPDETVDRAPFTYPGPNPQSMETSILMMADAVEAASRSLKDYSPESIDTLVNRIVDGQVADGLHNDSPISFRDISAIKKSFAASLRTMYHSRISYPEAIKPSQTSTTQK